MISLALVPFAPLLALPPRLVAAAASCACLLGGAALVVAKVRAGQPRAAEVTTATFAAVGATIAVSAWWLLASGGVGTLSLRGGDKKKKKDKKDDERKKEVGSSGEGGGGGAAASSVADDDENAENDDNVENENDLHRNQSTPLALATRFASVPWKAVQRASKAGGAICPFTGERATLRCPCCRTTVSRNAWHAGDRFCGLGIGGGTLLWEPAEAALEKEDTPMESRIKLDTALDLKGNYLFGAVSPCCIGCARALKTTNLLPRLGGASAALALALALVPWGLGASLKQLDDATASSAPGGTSSSAGSRVMATALCLALWCAAQCAAALAHAVGAAVAFAEEYECCRFAGAPRSSAAASAASFSVSVSASSASPPSPSATQQHIPSSPPLSLPSNRSRVSAALVSLASGPRWRGNIAGKSKEEAKDDDDDEREKRKRKEGAAASSTSND